MRYLFRAEQEGSLGVLLGNPKGKENVQADRYRLARRALGVQPRGTGTRVDDATAAHGLVKLVMRQFGVGEDVLSLLFSKSAARDGRVLI